MQESITNQAIKQKTKKISTLFVLFIVLMAIFLIAIIKTIVMDRKVPSQYATIHDRSFRGKIVSKDGYALALSQKSYTATIRGASIDPNKRELFIKLFSIYSGIDTKDIRKNMQDKAHHYKKGNVVLSKKLTQKQAMQLKSLAYKLRRLHVFRSIKTKGGIEVLYGLDIVENGESRIFPLHDNLSPVLGYVGKEDEDGYIRPVGQKGLERAYEKHITSKKDGYFKGKRDVAGRIIHDKNSIQRLRVDGLDLHINIPLSVQRRVELMLDSMKSKLDAQEIIVGVMESHTGKVLALASSNRFDPSHIQQKDIYALNPKFAEYLYEPGSVIKPITLAIALDHRVVTPNSWFKTGYHRFQIGKRRYISDDDFFESQTASDIIVHSSNIGISQISWRLTGEQFRDGLLAFGLGQPSGIDLSRDLKGQIKSLRLLDNQMHRANSSYGYGMMVSFAQLFKAYSAFNNDGVAVTPRIIDYLEDKEGNHYTLKPKVPDLHPIGKKAANQIHDILLRVVNDKKGTGRKARYEGLEIGGKTGTAHTVKNGHYVREYHSSFYGFANDKEGHKYTIGVLVIKAKKWHKYFASQSAVPTFRNIVQILVEEGYLKPDVVAKEQENTTNDIYKVEPSTSDNPTMPEQKPVTQNVILPTITKPQKDTPKVVSKPYTKPKTQHYKKPSTNIFDTIKTPATTQNTPSISKPKPKVQPKPKTKVQPKPKPKPTALDLF